MAIEDIVLGSPGFAGVAPNVIYVRTNNTIAEVIVTGYLNDSVQQGYNFSELNMVLVATKTSPSSPHYQLAWFQISHSGSNWSLISPSGPGSVALPTIANHLAVYTNAAGALGEDAATAINGGNIQAGLSGTAGTLISFPATASSGSLIIAAVANVGNHTTTISSIAGLGQNQVITIPDAGAATGSFLLNVSAAGQSVSSSSASATPGTIRALKGLITLSNATYANGSNSVAGVRGEVDMVGASSGFVYGVQGKVIPTGILSGSIWAPAVFGQYDLSGATINAGQIAAIWGDMGATGGTFTDVTGARMFAGTNTIASLTLNSMIYLYGKSSNLLELSGDAGTYITSGGAGAPSGTVQKISISIGGVQYYIVASTIVS